MMSKRRKKGDKEGLLKGEGFSSDGGEMVVMVVCTIADFVLTAGSH